MEKTLQGENKHTNKRVILHRGGVAGWATLAIGLTTLNPSASLQLSRHDHHDFPPTSPSTAELCGDHLCLHTAGLLCNPEPFISQVPAASLASPVAAVVKQASGVETAERLKVLAGYRGPKFRSEHPGL